MVQVKTTYRFCPSCSARLEQRTIENRPLAACPSCSFIRWTGPQVAVAALVVDPQQRVLLIRRGQEPGRGGWALPGGYVDGDEDPARAAERECLEETGCLCTVHSLAGAFHVAVPDDSLVVLGYVARMDGGKVSPTAEAPEVQWCPPDGLPHLVFSSHRQTARAWHDGSLLGL